MARIFTGLISFAAVVLMSAAAMAQCSDCQSGDCQSGQCYGGRTGCCLTGGQSPPWNRPYTEESSPDVFHNFYQPGNGGSPAGAFPAPFPTPHRIGHQYTTYQPFMPNEWLYMHHRTYHQSYNQGMGLNRTKVHWYGTPLRTDLLTLRKFFSKAR